MKKIMRIGIVGCGAIGSSLAAAVAKDFKGKARLTAVFDTDAAKADTLSRAQGRGAHLAVRDLSQLIARAELVIESASARSSWAIAKASLAKGRSVMIMSVGGVARHLPALRKLSERHRQKVYIPSGALAGIDALKAAREDRIRGVTLTTRKNPRAFTSVPYVMKKKIDLSALTRETLLFSGPAARAVTLFPQNINVAAILGLAGIGSRKTRVRIVADPSLQENLHEVEIRSRAGDIFTRTRNRVHPRNPKTSYLAVLAAVAMLRQIVSPVVIGT